MNKPVAPPDGSEAARFLKVLLTRTMAHHPEYLQRPGHAKLAALAEYLRELGWPVKARVAPAPHDIYTTVLWYYLDDEGDALVPGDFNE